MNKLKDKVVTSHAVDKRTPNGKSMPTFIDQSLETVKTKSELFRSSMKLNFSTIKKDITFPDLILARNISPRANFFGNFDKSYNTGHLNYTYDKRKTKDLESVKRIKTNQTMDSPGLIRINKSNPNITFQLNKISNPLIMLEEFNKNSRWKQYKSDQKKQQGSTGSFRHYESQNLSQCKEEEDLSSKTLQRLNTNKFSITTKKYNTFFQDYVTNISSHHKVLKDLSFEKPDFSQLVQYKSETAVSIGQILGLEADKHLHINELTDSIPKSCCFHEKQACYLFIKCRRKTFPVYICCDQIGAKFTYHAKFIQTLPSKEKHHQKSAYTPKYKALKIISNRSGNCDKSHGLDHKNTGLFINTSLNKTLDVNSIEKPSLTNYDAKQKGDYVVLELPEHIDEEKLELLYIQIMSPLKTRASFAVSFTKQRYLEIQKKLGFKAFSEKHQKEQFGNDLTVKTAEIEKLKAKKCDKEIFTFVNQNKKFVYNFPERKTKLMSDRFKQLAERTKNVDIKKKELHKKDMEKKNEFSGRNTFLKAKSEFEKNEQERITKLYYQMYFWCFIKRFHLALELIYERFKTKKGEADFVKYKMDSAKKIQAAFRFRFKFLSTKETRMRKTCFFAINLQAFHVRSVAYTYAKEAIAVFLKESIRSSRIKKYSLDFILTIKNMQKRFRNHLKVKKSSIELVESIWSKNMGKLVELSLEFNEMGININQSKLQYVTTDTRRSMCAHIVDRQLLIYTDMRYEKMQKLKDQDVEKKANKLSQNINLIEQRDKRLSIMGHVNDNLSVFSVGGSKNSSRCGSKNGSRHGSKNDSRRGSKNSSSTGSFHEEFSKVSSNIEKNKRPTKSAVVLQGQSAKLINATKKKSKGEIKKVNTPKPSLHIQKVESLVGSKKNVKDDKELTNKPNILLRQSSFKSINHGGSAEQQAEIIRIQTSASNNLKIQPEVLETIDNIQINRISKRESRRSVILQKQPELIKNTIQMLFDANCGTYEFSSKMFWEKLECSIWADLFRMTEKKAPEIIELRKQYIEKRRLEEEEKDRLEKEKDAKNLRKINMLRRQNTRFTKLKKDNINLKRMSRANFGDNDSDNSEDREAMKKLNVMKNMPKISSTTFNCEINDNMMQAMIIIAMEYCEKCTMDPDISSPVFKT